MKKAIKNSDDINIGYFQLISEDITKNERVPVMETMTIYVGFWLTAHWLDHQRDLNLYMLVCGLL